MLSRARRALLVWPHGSAGASPSRNTRNHSNSAHPHWIAAASSALGYRNTDAALDLVNWHRHAPFALEVLRYRSIQEAKQEKPASRDAAGLECVVRRA